MLKAYHCYKFYFYSLQAFHCSCILLGYMEGRCSVCKELGASRDNATPINGLNKHIQDKLSMQIMFPHSEQWICVPAHVVMVGEQCIQGEAPLGITHVQNICIN
jgi:hypothetical protein